MCAYVCHQRLDNLQLWCGNCLSFNPQWGFCITNFSYHTNNSNERRITEENQNRHVPQRINEIETNGDNNDQQQKENSINSQLSKNEKKKETIMT